MNNEWKLELAPNPAVWDWQVMSFLSLRHVPVQAEQLLCHDVMVVLFIMWRIGSDNFLLQVH